MLDTLFLRVDLLDLITLPASAKLHETAILAHLQKLLEDLWARTYKGVDLRPLVVGATAGASRAALPLWITLKDWLAAPDWTSNENRLPLNSASRKAYWTRFVVVLHNLQEQGLIREAIKSEAGADLGASLEFRYFAALLWLQGIRLAAGTQNPWPRSAALGDVAVARRPRSVSDGALEAPWSSPPNVGWERSGPRALSPRQNGSRESGLSFRLKALVTGNGLQEEVPAVWEAFFKALPSLLCIIGFHMTSAMNWTTESLDRSKLSELFISAHHLKYLALILQLRAVRRTGNEMTYDPPAPTKILEKHVFTELQNAKLLVELNQATPLISIGYLLDWLKNRSRVEIASVDALSSFAFALGGSIPSSRATSRQKPESPSSQRSPRTFTRTPDDSDDPARRFKAPDRILLLGRRREIIHVPTTPLDQPTDLLIMDCADCSIIAGAKFVNVKIGNCRNMRVIVPCATGSVILHFGKNVAVHCACSGVLISNSYDTRLYALSSTPPVIVGDTRDLHLGPYNVLWPGQEAILADTGINFSPRSLRAWSIPIVCPLSYTGRTNTPRDETLRKEGSKGRGSVDDTFMLFESGLMPSLVKPQDLEILIMPGEDHKKDLPPVPPRNLVLPEAHAQGVANTVLRRQAALASYLERVSKCQTEEQKRLFIQKTQTRFCEWLQTDRKVNELLSRSEEALRSRSPAVVS